LKLHFLRAGLFRSAMLCWFSAIPYIDLVDAVSLSFTAPIFATVLSALILREVVRVRRWTAILIGFSGTLVIVRPGFESISLATVLVMADAVIWAFALILVRVLARTEPPATIVAHMFAWVTPLSLVPALFVWTTPSGAVWLWILGMAISSTIGHLCATRALAVAETSAVMPFDYLRLLSFGVIGYVAFSEVPDGWTLAGAAIIVASTFYIGRREAKLARGERGRRDP
jgi:drug/metabolite transporter (DMT)-like permease